MENAIKAEMQKMLLIYKWFIIFYEIQKISSRRNSHSTTEEDRIILTQWWDAIVLAIPLVSTVGLPYAIGGMLQSGRMMQRIRPEESLIRFLTVLAVVLANNLVIYPWMQQIITIDGIGQQLQQIIDIILVATLVGVSGFVSWKAFTWGTSRGDELFSDDLYSTRKDIESTAASLQKVSAQLREDRKNDANKIQDMTRRFADSLKLDETMSEFLQKAVKLHMEETHIPRVWRICTETENTCITENNKLLDHIEVRFQEIFENIPNYPPVPSSLSKEEEDDAEDNDDNSADNAQKADQLPPKTTSLPRQEQSPPTPIIQKSKKILDMASIDLLRYKPKHHKMSIVLYNLLLQKNQDKSYLPSLSQISGLSGVNKADAKKRLQDLANMRLVSISHPEKSTKIEHSLAEKMQNLFNPVLENQREGGMESFYLIQEAKRHHLDNACYFEVLRQDITIEQPDAISIPMLDNESFDVANAVAIEIESPQEIRAHPEQVKANMTKNLEWFSKVEVWCYEDTQDKIQKILNSIENPEYWNKITIMPVHPDGSSA